jgi:hypothetical protein
VPVEWVFPLGQCTGSRHLERAGVSGPKRVISWFPTPFNPLALSLLIFSSSLCWIGNWRVWPVLGHFQDEEQEGSSRR